MARLLQARSHPQRHKEKTPEFEIACPRGQRLGCALTVLLWRRRSVTLHQTPRGVPRMQKLTAPLPIPLVIDELKAKRRRVVVTYVQDQPAVGARDRFGRHSVVLAEHA